MGYYTETDNIYGEEYYIIRENEDKISYISKIRIVEKPQIVIINNEDITFNLKNYVLNYYESIISSQKEEGLKVEKSNEYIIVEKSEKPSPYEKIKIKIDFGDGHKANLVKPLTHKELILNGSSDWSIIKHHYSFNDKKYFEKINYIVIEVKNIEGLIDKIVIPFTILSSLAADYNLKMDLLSANLTNDNNISFVFNILNNNQIVFASNKEDS